MADIISLLLTAKNDASKAINQVNKDISGLEKKVGSLSSVDKAVSAIGTGFAIGAFGATIAGIVSATAELSQAGANLDRLRYSFESLAAQNGTSGNEIISSIDAITQGTLSNQAIMEQANAAMLLGVANTGEEFQTLAKIAVDRGRAMGISMEYAFESIVKGVGRLSPLILDNLGIIVDADKTYGEFAKTIGTTADKLNDMQKRQALISRLKVEVANFDPNTVNDTASAWEKLGASVANFQAALGSFINTNSNAITIVGGLTEALRRMGNELSGEQLQRVTALKDRYSDLESQVRAYQELNEGVARGWTDDEAPLANFIRWTNDNQISALKKEMQGIADILDEIKRKDALYAMEDKGAKRRDTSGAMWKADEADAKQAAEMAEWVKKIGEYSKDAKGKIEDDVAAIYKMGLPLDQANVKLNDLVQTARIAKEAFEGMASAIGGAVSGFNSSVMDAFSASGFNSDIIDAAKAIRPAYDDALIAVQNLGYSEYDTEAATMQLQATFSESFNNISSNIDEATKSLNATGSSTKSLTKEFTSLRGIVEGIFSTAQSDFQGLGIDEILPREDAVNENARRLADIAKNGFKDQSWLEEFKNEAGGAFADVKLLMAEGMDAQGAAKKVLKDFQNGLRPDLIDTNLVKDIAKRMFYVDQSTNAMIDNIATDLAKELGISIEEAKGLAGSAMGKNKLSQEARQKIIDEEFANLRAKLGFDWGTKSATIQKGIDAGVLNKDGDLEVQIKPMVQGSSWLTIPGDTGFSQDKEISVPIKPTTDSATPFTLTLPPEAVTITPKVDSSTIATQVADINATVMPETPLKVAITTDQETVRSAGATAFADFASGFALPENLTAFGMMTSLGIANSFVEYSASYNTMGTQVGIYMFDGFRNQGLGGKIAAELGLQLSQAQKSFETSAGNAGKVWGGAFLTTVKDKVPFDLLVILTDLVTPEVIKKIAENKNRGQDG